MNFDFLQTAFEKLDTTNWLAAVVIFAIGWAIARVVRGTFARSEFLGIHHREIASRFGAYAVMALTITMVLNQLGFSLNALLGAAGILTVALGFASQTVASNVLSGIFLMGEQPFAVGDMVEIEAIRGQVVSIDLLSVRLKTLDNILVRIPNEMMLKSKLLNRTHFPVRRIDFLIGAEYSQDLREIRAVLLNTAARLPEILDDPEPSVNFLEYAESSVTMELRVWVATENFIPTRSDLVLGIKEDLDAAGISIPFPHRTLTVNAPLDLHVTKDDGAS